MSWRMQWILPGKALIDDPEQEDQFWEQFMRWTVILARQRKSTWRLDANLLWGPGLSGSRREGLILMVAVSSLIST